MSPLENNGGFVRLAHRPDSIDKNTKGIKFMAKGNDETYEIHVTMKGIKLPPWATTVNLLMLTVNGRILH